MPKIVDHEQRRRELGRALWRVIQQQGVEGASVRSVAKESGWSPSAVQYYFRTQAELLTFALHLIHEGAREVLGSMPADSSSVDLLTELLPGSEVSTVATEVWVAFLSRTIIDSSAREVNASANAEVATLCRELVVSIAPESDVELETTRLHALFDGLAVQAVTDPARKVDGERIRTVLERHLSSLMD